MPLRFNALVQCTTWILVLGSLAFKQESGKTRESLAKVLAKIGKKSRFKHVAGTGMTAQDWTVFQANQMSVRLTLELGPSWILLSTGSLGHMPMTSLCSAGFPGLGSCSFFPR